jgi:hypothetical protein
VVRRRRAAAFGAALVMALTAAACASSPSDRARTAASGGTSPGVTASELRSYVTQIEAIRLPVNDLLEHADPILNAYHGKKITPAVASGRMSALEQHFAQYLVDVNALVPSNPALAKLHAPYAHTYFYEDSYLSALASDLNDGAFDNLPDTQNVQRLAIIQWRTQLEILARRLGVALPPDLDEAGRGEIAPSPGGS